MIQNVLDFSDLLANRTKGFTGRGWVFNELDAWLANTNAGRVFLLTGEPGSGKTAIAARLAQFSVGNADPPSSTQSLDRRFLSAVHFCSATASDWIDPRTFARSLSLQLASIPEFALALKNVGDAEINIDVQQMFETAADGATVIGVQITNLIIQGLNGQDAFNRIVLDPLRTIYRDGYEKPTIILVDSLDEALASATDVTIVDLLAGLQGLDSRVRLILTSRVESRVENRFFGASGLFLSDPTYVVANDQDIREYVVRRLANDDRLKPKMASLPLAQAAALPDEITRRTEGNFLYGVFLLNAAAEGPQALDALGRLPSGLDGLYYTFLDRVVRLGKKDWSTVYKPMLGVLSVAQEPITLAQVQAYTGLPGDAWDALVDLRQFVEESPSLSARDDDEEPEVRYRLYHQSVGDFLRLRQIATVVNGQEKRYANAYRVAPEDWHKRVIAVCQGEAYSWEGVDWTRCDDYGLTHLPEHLSAVGLSTELHSLLLTYRWLQAKLDRLGVDMLLSDFSLGQVALDDAISQLRQALEHGAHVLAQNPAQLPAQLLGRLVERANYRIDYLRHEVDQHAPHPRLLPVSASLRQSQDLLRIFAGHAGAVRSVAVTHDGRIVSSAADGVLKVWELATGRELRSLQAHADSVNAVCLTSDDRLLVSASSDKTLKVWELASGQELYTLQGHAEAVNAVASTQNGRFAVSASNDRTLKVWDLANAQELRTLRGHQEAVSGVAVSSEDRWVISASSDQTLKVWDLADGQEKLALPSHTSAIRAVAITPDGRLAAFISGDNVVRLWTLPDGHETLALQGHPFEIRAVAFTPDGLLALSAAGSVSGGDNTIKVWDVRTGDLRHTFQGHTDPVNAVAVTPDGQFVVSASSDRTLRLWDLASIDRRADVATSTDSVNGLAAFPGGQFVISASRNKLKKWRIDDGAELGTLVRGAEDIFIRSVATTGNGQIAVTGSSNGLVQAWDLTSGAEQQTFRGHQDRVNAVAVTPAGERIISASQDQTLRLWDLASGAELATLCGHAAEVFDVIVTPDGRLAVSGSADNTLKIWNLATYEMVRTLNGHEDSVYALAVTMDGHVLSASWDHTLKVWELASGRQVGALRGHRDRVFGVAATPDGRRAISVGQDQMVKVWDLRNEECLATFHADGRLRACVHLPEQALIAAGGNSGRVHFLRWET